MRLLGLEICHHAPFRRAAFSFRDEASESNSASAVNAEARAVTVIHGPGGVGKTTLLGAIAATRPGSVVQLSRPGRQVDGCSASEMPWAIVDWALGQDDPERPHPLRLATPGARVYADEQRESLRRREQVLFDRVARDGGFVLLTLPSTRWFSKQPLTLSAPTRSLGHYDLRGSQSLDDGSRADLTRDTKQALAYAVITRALVRDSAQGQTELAKLGEAMHELVGRLAQLYGFTYYGLDAASFEPRFRTRTGASRSFDELPTQVRHLVAIGALALRAMWTAYPGRDPHKCEAVVAVDDVALHQDANVQPHIVPLLREVLPQVQWILTTTSGMVAGSVDTFEVLALRRLPEADHVDVFVGCDARTH